MDRYFQKLASYENVSTSYLLLAADTATKHVIVGKTGFTIYIQKILVNVTTDNAATQTFQDTAGTPVVAASTKASPGLGLATPFDWGSEGFALTADKGLDHVISGAGLAASITVQAYRKRTATSVGNTVGGGTPTVALP